MMEQLPGALGTSPSLALRLGQAFFSTASLLFMCLEVEFYGYTAFCFSVTVMAVMIPWSLAMAAVDIYSIFVKRPSCQMETLLAVVMGDSIMSFLSLASASSTAGAIDFLSTFSTFCSVSARTCSRYRLSSVMAFLSWFLSLASSLFNLWALPTS